MFHRLKGPFQSFPWTPRDLGAGSKVHLALVPLPRLSPGPLLGCLERWQRGAEVQHVSLVKLCSRKFIRTVIASCGGSWGKFYSWRTGQEPGKAGSKWVLVPIAASAALTHQIDLFVSDPWCLSLMSAPLLLHLQLWGRGYLCPCCPAPGACKGGDVLILVSFPLSSGLSREVAHGAAGL
uniref:Uncharacterized protein n=1 Tax=Gopherus evgoodei TaxID=1825980 RepID=A0A8C4WCV4_9SAUR